MITQHDIEIVVMLTNIVESDAVKCEQYWPNIGETLTHEPDEEDNNKYHIEMVSIINNNKQQQQQKQ